MNDDEARRIARAVLLELGLEVDKPNEMQADFVFLRRQREGAEQIGRHIRKGVLLFLALGLLTAVWWGVQAAFTKPPLP